MEYKLNGRNCIEEIPSVSDNEEIAQIDISNIDTNMLMRLLWENATNTYNKLNLNYVENMMLKQLHRDGYADYICGRPIKCCIYNTTMVNPTNYNVNNGVNKFQNIVKYIRFICCNTNMKYTGPRVIDSNSNFNSDNYSNKNFEIDPKVMAEARAMVAEFF